MAWGWPEQILAAAAVTGLIGLLSYSAWAWPRLPATLPIHFRPDGQPSGWCNRSILLWIPFVGILAFTRLAAVVRLSEDYSYLWSSPRHEQRRRLDRGLVLALRVVILAGLLHIMLSVSAIAAGSTTGLELREYPAEIGAVLIILRGHLVAYLMLR